MKKIIPTLIAATAVAAISASYLRKFIKERNEIKLIEIDKDKEPEKVKEEKPTIAEEVNEAIEQVVSETKDEIADIIEELDQYAQTNSEVKEPASEPINETVDEIIESLEETIQPIDDTVENTIDALEALTQEKAEELEDIIGEVIPEQAGNTSIEIMEETKDILDQILEEVVAVPEQQLPFEEVENISEIEEAVEEKIEEVIEEVIEEKANIVEEVKEEAQTVYQEEVQVEEIVEPKTEEPVEEVIEQAKPDLEKMDEAERTQHFIDQYKNLSVKKIVNIVKQVGAMVKALNGVSDVRLKHHLSFDSEENRAKFAQICEVEGYDVEDGEEKGALCVYNNATVEQMSLTKGILQLADDAAEFAGIYRGWGVE